MLSLILHFACSTPEGPPISPEVKRVEPPRPPEVRRLEGSPLTRECFAEAPAGRRGSAQGGSGGAPPPKGGGPGGKVGSKKQGRSPLPPKPSASAPVPKSAPTSAPEIARADDVVTESRAPGASATEPSGAPPATPVVTAPAPAAEETAAPEHQATEQKEEDRAQKERSAPYPEPDARSSLDWGGTTWLSNDDSMSLASAQRLLWAIQNQGPVKTSEVRPHELLNYFSFDTVEVPEGETFSVLGQAVAVEPGKLTLALAVRGVTPPRRPLDLTFVLDRSGSMWDDGRMEYLVRGLRKAKDQLVPNDRVDIVLFDDEVCTPLENYVVGRDDPAILDSVLDRLEPRGATNLDIGLAEAYHITNARTDTAGRNRRMLLVTDALLNEGEMDPSVLASVASGFTDHGIRLSTIGVGRSFDDKVLDAISERGKGAYVYLGSEAVVDRVFGPGFRSLTETIANDVHFALDLPESLALTRFYGEEASTVKSEVQPIDYYAGTTQLFLQDVAMRGSIPAGPDRIVLTIEWTDPVTGQAKTRPFGLSLDELMAGEVRNVKKGRALMAWTDLILARSMGGEPCAAPYDTWADRVRVLGADAEITWLDSLTSPLCGRDPVATALVASTGVPLKIKFDTDQVIAEVGLACGAARQSRPVSGTVATFTAEPGQCVLTVQGVVPMTAALEVPRVGGDVRCVLRGGRLNCG